MAITKYFSAKIASVYEARDFRHTLHWDSFKRRVASSADPQMRQIALDPERYLYVINHSVSAYEYFGPNENGDGFPDKELQLYHHTFIGKPVTVDHIEHLVVGSVIDSIYVKQQDPQNPLSGHYVQNVLAVDKKRADLVDPRLVTAIVEGTITDTSMGALVDYTECSICGNIAHTEHEYCVHVSSMKMQKIRTASGEQRLVFEICHDFQFFEDSIIRPFELGGLAGGRGADPRAKILTRIGAFISKVPSFFKGGSERRTAKPKMPPNTDALEQVQNTSDEEIPAEGKQVEEGTSVKVVLPQEVQTVEKKDKGKPKSYEVDEVKKRLKDVYRQSVPGRGKPFEDKREIRDTNLFEDVTEEQEAAIQSFIQEFLKKSSVSVSPDKEEAFLLIRNLVAKGVPVWDAAVTAWLASLITKEEKESYGGDYVIKKVLKPFCNEGSYEIVEVSDTEVKISLKREGERCSRTRIEQVLSELFPQRTILVVVSNA